MTDGAGLRARALTLLARREHTRVELRRKLADDADSSEQLERLLDDLADRQLLSDARYAEQRVSARGKRLGNSRLQQELRRTGVEDTLIQEALAAAGDETERARSVWKKKYGTLSNARADRARQARFLQSRGFSADVVRQVLKDGGDRPSDE